MSMSLDFWQSQLERQFSGLATVRKESQLPVFAIEHGLDASQLLNITSLLHASLRNQYHFERHWLVWIVYAAEQGYNYDGDEYWDTFEKRTPRWKDQLTRGIIRDWFQRFHVKYRGITPTGRWAKQFSIISWPITHAVLPKDLQQQLARALYELRYRLSGLIDHMPADVGRYVASATHDTTSRFRFFLEQEELAGRIILALLAGNKSAASLAIHPPTLQRIVTDLENVRSAREWLRDARRAVDVTYIKGASPGGKLGGQSPSPNLGTPSADRTVPSIRPLLTLRRTAKDRWTPVLEVPSFREIADLSPGLRTFLKTTRCSVSGANAVAPAGWLLTGAQRRVLAKWPTTEQPVIKFETPNPTIDHLLQSECRISGGPIWVFRIGSDGLAREIVGHVVRPGEAYILVNRGEPTLTSQLQQCAVDCDGVTATALSVPSRLTNEANEEIKRLGLSVAQTVRIWPAGLPARGWDGEGQTEWIVGEIPTFAIDHDYPVDKFEIELNTTDKIEMSALSPGQPVFIRLPHLPLGQHSLIVRAKHREPREGVPSQQPLEGVITLHVRAPDTWKPGTAHHSGLVVTADPPEPTLDDFWEGKTKLTVLGPDSRHVDIIVELLGGSGELLSGQRIGPLPLPVMPDAWSRAFEQYVRRSHDPWSHLGASSGRVVIDSEDLGSFSIPLHRDLKPVRWIWWRNQKTTLLRLVDDTAQDEIIFVRQYCFATPACAKKVDLSAATIGFEPTSPGGLYVACLAEERHPLVVSTGRVTGGLAGLLIDPDPAGWPTGRRAVEAILQALEDWSDAQLTGPLAAERRDRTLLRIRQQLFNVICGSRWADAERSYSDDPRSPGAADRLARAVGGKPAFVHLILRDLAVLADSPSPERLRRFAEFADRYNVCKSATLCEAALRLCRQPQNWRKWAGNLLSSYLEEFDKNRELVSGARFIALLRREALDSAVSRARNPTP